jgi:hypothetical protein
VVVVETHTLSDLCIACFTTMKQTTAPKIAPYSSHLKGR